MFERIGRRWSSLKRLLFLCAAIPPAEQTIGGIKVLVDNCQYRQGNHKWNESTLEDESFFLTGWYDTGSEGEKSYTAKTQYKKTDVGQFVRFFNDQDADSVDYWSITAGDSYPDGTRTFTSEGRYIIAPIYKEWAADSYIYDNTNNRYVFKGSNITE